MPKTPHRVITTDAQIDAALKRAKAYESSDRRATKVSYDSQHDRVTIDLLNGVNISIPRRQLQGLDRASPADLADVELAGHGTGLHWPRLDVDHYLPGLLNQVFGTRQWMADLGRMGGAATTAAKKRAARANGRKGGRPKRRKTA